MNLLMWLANAGIVVCVLGVVAVFVIAKWAMGK